jgi:hypothetical protein
VCVCVCVCVCCVCACVRMCICVELGFFYRFFQNISATPLPYQLIINALQPLPLSVALSRFMHYVFITTKLLRLYLFIRWLKWV